MSLPGPSKRLIRFDDFEVDVHSGELRKHGLRIKLQVQPFQVLAVLLEKPGETVTREELQRCIWPADTFVDFDQGLNNAVKKLREALGDDAVNPRFVETLPKRGYRFAAQVVLADGRDGQGTFGAGGLEAQPTAPPRAGAARKAAEARQTPRGRAAWIASLAVVALFVGLAWKFEWIRPALPVGQIRSLAVLPLTNLSGDAEQEYFAEGMTDELITDLAQISALRVISRTSVMHYKGTTETMPQIARELNVDAVLEGSVQRSGDQVRIRAQLIYASTERHLWAKSYQGSLGDVLALQNEVARAIAHEIKIQVTPQEETRLANPGPVNLEAHEAYLKGRYYLNKRTEEGFRGAVQYFSEAVQKDRNYGLGYAGLADSYILLGEYSLIPAQDAFPTARNAAAKALELDDTLAEAHNALAAVKTDYDWDWSGAEGEFRRAIGLNPSYATAHQWYAELLSALGRHREALAEIRQAQQLDPFSQIINTVNGDILRTAGQLDLAIEQLRNTLEIDPNFAHAHFHLGMTYLRKGAFTEAVSEFQRAATLSPSVADYKGGLGYAYARAGNRAEARKVLDELKERSKRTYISWFYIAAIHAGLNEKDQAFACLEKAYEQREQGLAVMNREPMFDPLRSDPRFEGLLHRMGLE